MRSLALVALVGLLCSCGGGGPTAPGVAAEPASSTLAPPAPSVVDGVTGAYLTAEITPPQPARNKRVTVRAPGYLVREQLYTGDPIRLWPAQQEGLVHQLVYVQATNGVEISMQRWESSGVVLSLPPEIADSEPARATFERAAAEATRITGFAVGIGSNGQARVILEPQSFVDRPRTCAFTRLWLLGAVITQAEIVYRGLETALGLTGCDAFGVASHEVGHVLGLQHVDDPKALMNRVLLQTAFNTYEEQSLQLMYHYRRAGNGAPDREPGLTAAAARVRVELIVD